MYWIFCACIYLPFFGLCVCVCSTISTLTFTHTDIVRRCTAPSGSSSWYDIALLVRVLKQKYSRDCSSRHPQYATRWWTLRPNTQSTTLLTHTRIRYASRNTHTTTAMLFTASLCKSTARIKPRTLKWPSHSSAVAFRHQTPNASTIGHQLLPHRED